MRGSRTLASAIAVSLASASGCHHAAAPARHTEPAPATRAIAAVTPALTDRQWIDSVAQSWAAQHAARAESSAARPVAARGSRRPVVTPAVALNAPTTSATSYAEAAAPGTGRTPTTDDRAPLIVICAIGATAFIIATASARVAFGW